jgi:hypothetical protein
MRVFVVLYWLLIAAVSTLGQPASKPEVPTKTLAKVLQL